MNQPVTGHTRSASDELKQEARKALRDLYEDRDCPHRAELIKVIEDAMLDIGIPPERVNALAEESLRGAAYKSDEPVRQEP